MEDETRVLEGESGESVGWDEEIRISAPDMYGLVNFTMFVTVVGIRI